MDGDDGVPGWDIGPAPEQLRYINTAHRNAEATMFWSIAELWVTGEPGGEHDLPMWMHERGTAALLANGQHGV